MKKALVVCFLFILALYGKVSSQVYYLNNGFTNGGKVVNCAGTFKDSNPYGNYSNNENYSVTFSPVANSGQAIQIDFDTLDIASGDAMFVHDGPTLASPILTELNRGSGAPFSLRATAANPGGKLTIHFVSKNSGPAKGWSAKLSCKSPCQQISVKLTTVPAAGTDGFINVCKGQEVIFRGTGVYNENDSYYHQSDTTSKYLWSFSNGKDTSGFFAHEIKRTFNAEEGTIVQLSLVDENECYNLIATQVKIRTALTPTFNIPVNQICLNDTVKLVSKPAFAKATFSNLPVYSDTKQLSDGIGKCYETSINVTKFLPGQKFTNLNELEGILLNIEHSWMGDITIAITAPNLAKVYLKKAVSGESGKGWESFLGEPVRGTINSPLSSIIGNGYDYLFSPSPTYGTMEQEKGKYTYSFTDNAGQQWQNHTYLPEGSYASEEPLSGLLGTPLNGLWTIEVCDNFQEDNGFIFYWTIKFKPEVYPNSESYTSKVTAHQWFSAPGLVSSNDSLAVISPASAGNFSYKYGIKDGFGCSFDTTVIVKVNPLPAKPDLGKDTSICLGLPLNLKVNNAQSTSTYNWSTGAVNVNNITITQQGLYWVTAQNANGCKLSDTIKVINSSPVSISLGGDTMYCASSPNVLTPVVSGNISSFEWSTGVNTQSLTINSAGTYIVTGKTTSGCLATDTIKITDNPVNLFSLPPDTTICLGTSYTLNINPPAGSTTTWSDGSTANTKLIQPGTYVIVSTFEGCSKNDELQVGIRPLPVVTLGGDTVLCTGFDLPLSVSYPGASYLWSTGSRSNSIVARNTGIYWVEATLNSCTYRDSIEMTQQSCDCNVSLPNAFSPNGDGINDVYRAGIGCFPKDYHFSVFNRYGQLLFDTKNYQAPWDGTMNGKALPVGTYYYILTFYNNGLQKTEQFKGGITLLK